MPRAGNLTTLMCRLSTNTGTSTSCNPHGLSRPVQGLPFLEPAESTPLPHVLHLKIHFNTPSIWTKVFQAIPSRSLLKTSVNFSSLTCMLTWRPSHPRLFYHPNSIRWRLRIMDLAVLSSIRLLYPSEVLVVSLKLYCLTHTKRQGNFQFCVL